MSKSVSVVVPVHNAEAFVAETIESVLAQTVPPMEIIAVDDGSTDGTAAILRGFGDQVQVLSRSGRSAASARNAGAAAATGVWLAFVDADDTWLPNKLERQLAFTDDPRVGMVYTDRFNIGDRGDLPAIQSEIQHMYAGDVFLDLLLLGNRITLSSVMVRRDLFNALGGFYEGLRNAEDWDLWVRLSADHQVAVCDEPLLRYRFHRGMKSGNPQRMQVARREVIRRALLTPRGRALPLVTRRRILAETARTNGFDAARRGARWLAWQEYGRSLATWPFHGALYGDLARLLLGRL